MNEFRYDGEISEERALQLRRESKTEPGDKPATDVDLDDPFDYDLAFGLLFTPVDLATNQAGYISFQQRDLLHARDKAVRGVMAGLTICLVFFMVFVLVGLAIGIAGLSWLADAMGVLIAIPAMILMIRIQPLSEDLRDATVESLSGPVTMISNTWSTRFTLRIKNQVFDIEREAYWCFREQDHYTIYYTPRSRIILSAEPL